MSSSPSILQRLPPYCLRRNVFSADDHAALLAWTLANEATLTPSMVAGYVVNPDARNSRSLRRGTEPPWRDPLTSHIVSMLPVLLDELGVAPFPIDKIDAELVAYNDGGFLRRHVDVATRTTRHTSDRIVTAVYYFHAEPKGFTGGELRLVPRMLPPPGTPAFVDVPPHQNCLVAFPSWALHEVLEVRCPSHRYEDSRFAINFWIRRAHS